MSEKTADVSDSVPASLGPQHKRSLWMNLSFMLMWTSVAASGFGDRLIQLVAKPMLGVNNEESSAAQIAAAISFFFFVPYFVFTLIGGWLADRVSRKWVMLACDECRALVLLLAWWWMGRMLSVPDPSIEVPENEHWRIYAIIALTGVFAAMFTPSRFATVPQIVPVRQLQQANAVLAAIALISSLLGMVVGTEIIQSGGAEATARIEAARMAVLVGALCFGISGVFFAFMDTQQHGIEGSGQDRESMLRQFIEAFHYLRHHRAALALVAFYTLFWACCFVVQGGVASLVKLHYDIPLEEYLRYETMMMATFGGGLMLASIIMMLLVTRREADVMSMAALAVSGVGIVALALSKSIWLGVPLCLLIGVSGGMFLILVDTLTQSLTPDFIRGRVFGLRAMVDTIGVVGVNFLIWRLAPEIADKIMPWAMGVMGAILVLLGVVGVIRLLRRGPMNARANILWHLARLFLLTWHRLQWKSRHHVPSKGRVILAANHTTGLDPFLIQAAVPRLVRWVMTRDYRYGVMNVLWREVDPILVDREGADVAPVRQMLRELKKPDIVMGIFPEGFLQRDNRELKEFEAGVGLLARRSDAMICPVWISGTPRQKKMLWHFLTPSRSKVCFGEPYRPDPKLSNEEVATDLRDRMLALAATCDNLN